uniref:Coronin n=1 Tax=Spumella elongata TaxID=89044 RepID=A0A7S3H1X9_9STRA|mmetsp:Transcript_31067/g.53257  ORF Transcript_31067/g.53257 Transcript_31067/m.53257 type:complete len:444 (+) Transcript_31067:90-1421(+)
MSSFVRSSKFRHVFCDPPRVDAQFTNLRLSTVTGEQNYIKANPKYFAVALSGGGGPITVINLDKPGRMLTDQPVISGHSAAVLDFEFNPFNDQIIATGSEDTTVKVWGIPEGGLTANITTPLVDLTGHSRKVTLLRFHPTAENVLASVGGENTVKLWDIQKGVEINSLSSAHDQLIQDIVWDYTGTEYATSCKDKNIRIIDARSAAVSSTIEQAHEGAKSMKLTYAGTTGKLISVGFTRQSQRQFKIWDPRNTAKELEKVDIDQAAGVIMPFYDADTNLLYLAGKGDGNVRYYEISSEAPHVYPLSDFRSSVSAKGMAWVPKRGLDVMACESARLMKLTTNSVEPLSFFVPRKSDSFQDDIYPDTASYTAAHTADEWLAGSDKPPVLMSLNPALRGSAVAASVSEKKVFVAAKTAAQLQIELDQANARIKDLEARLAAAGLEA